MAELFNIELESDLSEWSSTGTDGGDLSQGSPGLAGTSGRMEMLLDDTTAIYGVKDFTTLTSEVYRFRFYIDINSLTMAVGNTFRVGWILATGPTVSHILINLKRTSPGVYGMEMSVYDDAGTPHSTAFHTVSDAEHHVEILVQYADDAEAENGYATFWIDDVEEADVTGLDLYTRAQPDQAQLGAIASIDAGTSGTFHLDEFVFRDDATEIGAVSAGVTVPPLADHHYRSRRA